MEKMRLRFKGISLLELMLSLAIIAILLLLATRYFQTTRSAQQVSEAVKMVDTLTGAADSWLSNYHTFNPAPPNNIGAISIANLQQLGLIPNNFANNPWGGSVTVTPQDSQHVSITFTNVNARDCQNLILTMQQKDYNNVSCLGAPGPSNFVLGYPNP